MAIHGYPGDWCTQRDGVKEVDLRPYTRLVRYYEGGTRNFSDYDDACHLLLNHRPNETLAPEMLIGNQPSTLHGISGSSVWQLLRDGDPPERCTQEAARIVAIETGVYRGGKVVKATRWASVEHILRDVFPDLQRPLSVITPEPIPPDGNVDGLSRISV